MSLKKIEEAFVTWAPVSPKAGAIFYGAAILAGVAERLKLRYS